MKRRTFLGLGAGFVSAAALAGWKRNDIFRWHLTRQKNENVSLTAASVEGEPSCVLTSEQMEGPYRLNSPLRRDVREDRVGVPLLLELKIVRGEGCAPVERAQVEIWHCDATGVYSGYEPAMARKPFDTVLAVIKAGGPNAHIEAVNDSRFLRGAQLSDTDGRVIFQTIVPGWYDPRVPHIHVKVRVGDESFLTTQLYFPDEMTQAIYASHPDYKAAGACPYTHGNDPVLGDQPDANGLLLKPVKVETAYKASATLRIKS